MEKLKICVLFGIFLLTHIGAHAQTNPTKGNQYSLIGKINTEAILSPHCGNFSFALVIEFEIIEFSDATYQQETIGVIVTCPESYGRDFFEKGKTYRLIVADENQGRRPVLAGLLFLKNDLKSMD